VTLDERDERPGWKFAEWELRGVPLRLEIGPKDIEKSAVLIARRDTREKQSVPMAGLADKLRELLNDVQRTLLARARSIDPADRPTAAQIAAALRDDTASPPTQPLPSRRRSWRRPHRAALLLAALAFAALAAAIAVAATSGSSPKPPPRVAPVTHSTSADQEARNLAAWLKRYSR